MSYQHASEFKNHKKKYIKPLAKMSKINSEEENT